MKRTVAALLACLLLCLGGCAPAGDTGTPPPSAPSEPASVPMAGFDFSPQVRQVIVQGYLDGWAGWDPALCPDLLVEQLPRVKRSGGAGVLDGGADPLLAVPVRLAGEADYPAETALTGHRRMAEFFAHLESGTPDEIAVLTSGDPIPMIFQIYTFDGGQLYRTIIHTGLTDPDYTDFRVPDPLPQPDPIRAVETELEWQFLSADGAVAARYPKYGFAPRQFADEADLRHTLAEHWAIGWDPAPEVAFYDAGTEEYAGARYRLIGITTGDGADHGACYAVSPDLSRCWYISKVGGEHYLLACLDTAD